MTVMTMPRVDAVEEIRRFNLSITTAMGAAGISRQKLADGIGMSRPSLSQRLLGNQDWQLSEMVSVGNILGVHYKAMLDDERPWLNDIDPHEVRERLDEIAGQSMIGSTPP
ncbi:hypothetical protein RCO28_27675 [Streptomyces sp. LHD-70]|uniref:hypothetical protein n=1 Tax=Streptomyces sp. LHD-70 TaxID=3072140 RepID=UPI00280DF0CE|nr:hypothetical protein [Streptomyces sp. LHD-70]MDQ8706221.1 hypothetical protein [Streptomyces sp. LHD-70]